MKVYYSRSNEVKDGDIRPQLLEFIRSFPNYNYADIELLEYKRGSRYSPEMLLSADMVIVGLRNPYSLGSSMGKGCADEIRHAIEKGIPVFALVGEQADIMVGSHSLKAKPVKLDDLHYTGQSQWTDGYAVLITNNDYGVYVGDKKGVFNMLQKVYGKKFDKVFNFEESLHDAPKAVVDNPDDGYNEDLLLL